MTSHDHHDRYPARAGLTAPGARRPELLAVSHAGQSWIIASILSRRPQEMWSHLAYGTGMHRIDHGARIHRNNRRSLSVSAAGVVPVTVVMLRWFVPRDRCAARTRAGVPGAEETSRAIAYGVFGVWAGRA